MYKIININQNWMFKKEGEEFAKVTIPHTWNISDGYNGDKYYRGIGIYEKTTKIELKENQHAYLEFNAVNSVCEVYVNDTFIYRHHGGYSNFRVNVTEFANAEMKITVKADNSYIEEIFPLVADFTFFGGMYRNVNLIVCDNVHFALNDYGSQGVYVSQKEISQEKCIFEVKSLVNNFGSKPCEVKSVVRLLDAEGIEIAIKEKVAVVTASTQFKSLFEVNNLTLWDGVENPYLYDVEVKLYVDGVEVDERIIPTGFRFFDFDASKGFFLNGRPYRLNGVSRHQCRDGYGWAQLKEHHDEDMQIMLEMGANSIRLAHYQHDDYFYHLCDKYGMIIWAEIPYITKPSKTDETGENAISQMTELIRQNYNHSSIVMWGVQNEITVGGKLSNVESIVQDLHDLTKKEDSYRVTTQAQVGHHPDDDTMQHITDVLAYNKYFGWYYDKVEDFDGWLSGFKKINPSVSLGISEYVVEGILKYHTDDPKVKDYSEEYHALYHETVMPIFNSHENIWGTYVWNMFDFASAMRDEGGVQGMNNKGLVTFDRKIRKDAFYYYKALWSKDAVLHLTSKRYEKRHKDVMDIKIYTNQNDVEVYMNGDLVATQSPQNCTVVVKDVKLSALENEVIIKANGFEDKAVFTKVDGQFEDYVLDEADAGGIVDNCFGDLEVSEKKEMTFDESRYSIKDTIVKILENEAGEAVLRKYIGPLFDHAMFDMAKSMTLEAITNFAGDAISDVVISNINYELQQVEK